MVPRPAGAGRSTLAGMQTTVLGATGTIGSRIADQLEERGHQVKRASRSNGIDAWDTAGLEKAFNGDTVVVDCLNIETIGAKKSREFFTGTAKNITQAAQSAGVGRIVCVSIAGAADPKVNRLLGYYQGKAAQEQTYLQSAVPTTIIHSAQWFELMDDVVRRAALGPITVLPTMKMAALAADRAAAIIAHDIEQSAEDFDDRTLAIRGPEEATMLQISRAILAAWGSIGGRRPRVMTQAPYLGRAIATGGLVPGHGITDDLTVAQWLAGAK